MKKLRTALLSIAAITGLLALPLVPATVFAASPAEQIKQGVTDVGGTGDEEELSEGIKTIVNVMLFILGAIAVIMIIIGGIRYATSNGDSSQLQSAKNTILYAVVGLVIAILAYAIVQFIIEQFIG